MRIDAYNQVAQLYGAQKTYNTQKANKTASMGSDQLSISQAGYSYQAAKAAVAGASDVREDKVAMLKEKIQNGTYSVDPEDFASKLLEKYNSIM